MMDAEIALLRRGADAIPLLETLFNGEAKNDFGVPYRSLGLPLRCALEVARRLGPVARPLEPYLRAELRQGHHVTAMALGSLGSLEEESIHELAAKLDDAAGIVDLPYESAKALLACGQASHTAVKKAANRSDKAANVLAKVIASLS